MVERVAAFAEVGPFLHMPTRTYSSGMRARLAFGISMAVDFEVYLIDEVTAVGDSSFRRKCAAAFREKMDQADIIMCSHAENTLCEYCDAGMVLEGGKLTYYDDIADAIAAHEANMRKPVLALA